MDPSVSWSVIRKFYVNNYGGLNFLLLSTYDKKFLIDSYHPSTRTSCLNVWDKQELIFFNKKEIFIDGRCVFFSITPDWVEKGVFILHDDIDTSGKWHFNSFSIVMELIEIFSIIFTK